MAASRCTASAEDLSNWSIPPASYDTTHWDSREVPLKVGTYIFDIYSLCGALAVGAKSLWMEDSHKRECIEDLLDRVFNGKVNITRLNKHVDSYHKDVVGRINEYTHSVTTRTVDFISICSATAKMVSEHEIRSFMQWSRCMVASLYEYSLEDISEITRSYRKLNKKYNKIFMSEE